jgi:hypothetical protein
MDRRSFLALRPVVDILPIYSTLSAVLPQGASVLGNEECHIGMLMQVIFLLSTPNYMRMRGKRQPRG